MVIEPALRQLHGGGDVVHRGGIVSLLLKQARGRAQNFLARFNGRFAVHYSRWYRGNPVSALLAGPVSWRGHKTSFVAYRKPHPVKVASEVVSAALGGIHGVEHPG